jgi:tetratricopeptide (TPR) repeat protein
LYNTLLAAQAADDPDRLYANRTNLASAEQAATIWEERLSRQPNDYEAAWKLARAAYWLGGHVAPAERRKEFERGVAAATRAVAIDPQRPEGHFWKAANMGALAESYGARAGLKYRGAIKDALETVLKIDPAFEQGSADRALGRWYQKVPRLFGGSKDKAEEHLRRSLTYNSNSSSSHFFLAELFLERGRRAEARAELEKVLVASSGPDWAPEDAEFKARAKEMLTKLGGQ